MSTKAAVYGVELTFWSKAGTITHVLPKSETEVWSSGGGGYVDPQYGGVVNAPRVYSRTIKTKEVRLACDDGSAQTLTVPDSVRAYPGERASIIWARPSADQTGHAHGFKNHREGAAWYFNTHWLQGIRFRSHPFRALLCGLGTWSRPLAVLWMIYALFLISTNGPRILVPVALGFAAIFACFFVNAQTKAGIASKAGEGVLAHARTLIDAQPAGSKAPIQPAKVPAAA